jgi:cytochrome c551
VADPRRQTPMTHILPWYGFLVCALVLIVSCTRDQQTRESAIKFDQYYIQGERLFIRHCSNCHQKNGTGLGRLFPPLNKSDYVENNFEGVICLIRNGIGGELVVNGKSFNQAMPAIPSLTDLEIAEISTYIYNSWERKLGIVEVKKVSAVLKDCGQ